MHVARRSSCVSGRYHSDRRQLGCVFCGTFYDWYAYIVFAQFVFLISYVRQLLHFKVLVYKYAQGIWVLSQYGYLVYYINSSGLVTFYLRYKRHLINNINYYLYSTVAIKAFHQTRKLNWNVKVCVHIWRILWTFQVILVIIIIGDRQSQWLACNTNIYSFNFISRQIINHNYNNIWIFLLVM